MPHVVKMMEGRVLLLLSRLLVSSPLSRHIQLRPCSTSRTVPVVRVPVRLQAQLDRKERLVYSSRRPGGKRLRDGPAQGRSSSKPGRMDQVVISTRRKNLAHFKGQTYGRLEEVPLASKGWCSGKAKGDFLNLQEGKENPSLDKSDPASFGGLGLDERLVEFLPTVGIHSPTSIQSLAIPEVLRGRNTLVAAETGSGKTLSFLAPIVNQIVAAKMVDDGEEAVMNSPRAVVITPGRELAVQTYKVASHLGRHMGFNTRVLVGGATSKKLRNPTVSEVDLLVATPGALNKFSSAGVYKPGRVGHVVLDEVDTLLDDSFSELVKRYLGRLHGDSGHLGVQLTMVGATMPKRLDEILGDIISVDSIRKIMTPHLHRVMPHVPQKFLRMSRTERPSKLLDLVKQDVKENTPVIVFSNKSATCDWISLFLNEQGVKCINLHGGMHRLLRQGRFDQFQAGEFNVLSCTDVVSRGLDTFNTGHVINFDFPPNMSDYIHRSGRTGRVGSSIAGRVTSFVCKPHEIELVQKIEHSVRKVIALPNVNANIKRILMSRYS